MADPSSSTSTLRQSEASSSSSAGASSSSSSSASSSNAYYPLLPHPPALSASEITTPMSLREPPSADLIPANRPTLTQFRQSEGATSRSQKLKTLWQHLPSLPEVTDGPSATACMQLPDQDTYTALSPERAERLRRLYEEELVKRVGEERPEARLWGGADDQEPEIRGKGIAWQDFR